MIVHIKYLKLRGVYYDVWFVLGLPVFVSKQP